MRDIKRDRAFGLMLAQIRSEPPPPCDTCSMANICRKEKMACWDFARYCDHSLRSRTRLKLDPSKRKPSKAMFDYVFRQI